MKISVSMPEEDVAFLDEFAQEHGIESRSAVLHVAIERLRSITLESAYAQAFAEWAESEDAEVWDAVSGDGIADASG